MVVRAPGNLILMGLRRGQFLHSFWLFILVTVVLSLESG